VFSADSSVVVASIGCGVITVVFFCLWQLSNDSDCDDAILLLVDEYFALCSPLKLT
jgi:hypothetical protein